MINERERIGFGRSCRKSEMREFTEFIFNINLIDVQCKGKSFSWYSGDGRSMSRLDRFLISDILISNWEVVGQLIDKMDISDHFPIWLVINQDNWGPKPFKVNDGWFDDTSFFPFVERE